MDKLKGRLDKTERIGKDNHFLGLENLFSVFVCVQAINKHQLNLSPLELSTGAALYNIWDRRNIQSFCQVRLKEKVLTLKLPLTSVNPTQCL